jgi:hypothetical protein
MTKYYIVTQADTDANGDFEYPVGIFADDDGNTQLCINAEEARQLIAEELAEMCETKIPFSLNDGEAVEFDLKSKIIEYVLQNMKPEDGQYAIIQYSDGSQRLYTLNSITV